MNLSIGGTPATAEQLENLRTAMGVPSRAEWLSGKPTVQSGLARVTIDGQYYAMLPLDINGNIVANITHRTGLLAALLEVTGSPGEIAVPTDVEGFVVYNASGVGKLVADLAQRTGTLAALMAATGVPGEIAVPTDADGVVVYNPAGVAKHLAGGIDNSAALGTNSLALGEGAQTVAGANLSTAIGPNAKALYPGEHVQGSPKVGIHKSLHMFHKVTVGDTSALVGPGGSTQFTLPAQAALYQVKLTAFVRDGYLNEWQRMVRCALVKVADDQVTASVAYTDTPIPDRGETLTGCTASVIAEYGLSMAVSIKGVAGKTLNWGIFLEIEAFTEEVLL